VGYLALFLVDLARCLLWDMLFARLPQGRSLLVGLCRFGLYVGCSCMASNMTNDICGSQVGILNECCGVGTKAGLRMEIAMVDASGMCD
jgi:hypothetical protein